MKILATLDGSIESRAILPVLYKFAGALKAEVTLLTVVPPQTGTPRQPAGVASVTPGGFAGAATGPTVSVEAVLEPAEAEWVESKAQAIEGSEAEARDWLRDAAAPLAGTGLAISEEAVMDERPARAIVEFARLHAFDLILMATHGRTGLREVVQGSVAEDVVRSGVAPVLLVRPGSSGD